MDRPSQTTAISKESIVDGINSLIDNVFSFWQRFGLDAEHGGFHGTLDRAGAAVTPTSKGLVQQARHLWQVDLSLIFLVFTTNWHKFQVVIHACIHGVQGLQHIPPAWLRHGRW